MLRSLRPSGFTVSVNILDSRGLVGWLVRLELFVHTLGKMMRVERYFECVLLSIQFSKDGIGMMQWGQIEEAMI